eukprot:TRINITY_DN3496_c0_g1_i1.p1 TRINITY_DN3496_c0_g1~~TRINITY_DN3496_c0_g1_i1.p1  ORF type:complete len:191 (-),score=41.06 TRINITY_DN3496_c0_g1_i1:39-611(-)
MNTIFFLVITLVCLATADGTLDPSKSVADIMANLTVPIAQYNELFSKGEYPSVVLTALHPGVVSEGFNANITYSLKATANATDVQKAVLAVVVSLSNAPDYRFTVNITLGELEIHNGTEGLSAGQQSFSAFVEILQPEKPFMVLYIIIIVITVAALIITIVLVISLNKKKSQPEYQQIEDYAGERITENF